MRLSSATVTLAGVALTGDVGITALSISGQSVASIVQLPRATASVVSGRGNDLMQIQFTAVREFASDTALEQFAVSHFGALVKSGALTVTVSGVTKTASSAAVQSVTFGEPMGLLLPITYSIVSSPLL